MITTLQPPFNTGKDHVYGAENITSSYSDRYSVDLDPVQQVPYSSKRDFVHAEYKNTPLPSEPSTAPSSPSYTYSMSNRGSFFSTPTCSNLDPNEDYGCEDDDETGFPMYENKTPRSIEQEGHETYTSISTASTDDNATPPLRRAMTATRWEARDDSSIEYEPSHHVDYLSHEWEQPDIWSSWRYIVARRDKISNCERLENAAWRTWVKAKYQLATVNPESLNWMKDCDVTWLYGPLHTHPRQNFLKESTPPASQLSTCSSFLNKKPILKKRSPSAILLEKSLNEHTLLQRAGEIIQIQRNSPVPRGTRLSRRESDFSLPSYHVSSVLNTPDDGDYSSEGTTRGSFGSATPLEAKHVFFNEEVRQVQAIDSEDDEKEREIDDELLQSDEDDDGGLMMAPTRNRSARSTPRSSFSEGNKTIAPLPPTTLKSRSETPRPSEAMAASGTVHRGLYHSPSQETLKPQTQQNNILMDDDPEVDDAWFPRADYGNQYMQSQELQEQPPGMRRTASGMFMPDDDENGDEAAINNGLLGQAVYAVNTFRDIAHVIWNVGWTRNR